MSTTDTPTSGRSFRTSVINFSLPLRPYLNTDDDRPPTRAFSPLRTLKHRLSANFSSTPILERLRRKSSPRKHPIVAREWSCHDLLFLVSRWEHTFPGPFEHAENMDITRMISHFRKGLELSTEAEQVRLYSVLRHRHQLDVDVELAAASIGLLWECSQNFSYQWFASVPAAENGRGIESFVPPPEHPLSPKAREILRDCRGAWKERVGTGEDYSRERYSKPRYWIAEVAAANGWSARKLDRALAWYFEVVDNREHWMESS